MQATPESGQHSDLEPRQAGSAALSAQAKRPAWVARWGKRAGTIAFLFFFIKGLAWLVVPVALATWWAK